MKAKMYAKEFNSQFTTSESYNEKNLTKQIGILGNSYMREFDNIRIARNIGQGSEKQSLINLINEFNEKWQKMTFIINEYFAHKFNVSMFDYNGFKNLLKITSPVYIDILSKM